MFIHQKIHELPDLKAITDPRGSRVYITPEGQRYPSITTILGAEEKPYLEQWKRALGEAKAEAERKRTAHRGTMLHEIVEKYLNNHTSPTESYKDSDIRLFNQIKPHLKKINNIRTQEQALYSDELKVAGRVDCIGEYEGALSVIDFKSSTKDKSEDMINDYFLQCTAYALMWYERTGELIENIVVIIATERGIVPLVFRKTIDKYIKALTKRISEYHGKRTTNR